VLIHRLLGFPVLDQQQAAVIFHRFI
jgi:hypothetical protein